MCRHWGVKCDLNLFTKKPQTAKNVSLVLGDFIIYLFSFPATKETDDVGGVADILGVSAVIVQSLKMKRGRHYEFSWDETLRFRGKTGVFLQCCHARLFKWVEQFHVFALILWKFGGDRGYISFINLLPQMIFEYYLL